MMKHYINRIALLFACGLLATACSSIHDNVDDLVGVGEFAPHVYWEQVPTSLPAGQNAKFELQYYPADNKTISKLQVWYNIYSTVKISASCPIVSSFTYAVTDEDVETVREFVPVLGYEHSENYWNTDKRAYYLAGTFPTTYTLAPISWTGIEEFDGEKFSEFFPKNFENDFRDSIYTKMKVIDFKKVFTVTNPRIPEKSFYNYIDSTKNETSGRMDYTVKPEYVEFFKTQFYSIPYDSLFYDASTSTFKLEYEKVYTLGAKFKVTDSNGIFNFSEEKLIELR